MDYKQLLTTTFTPDSSQGDIDAARRCVRDLIEYHTPTADHVNRMAEVRKGIETAMLAVVFNVPASPTRTRALNALMDARMLANAAVIFGGAV
jgi:hypothetical protein